MILNELMKVKNEMQSKPLKKLEEGLLSEMHITNKQWLIEKISQLKDITDKR
jgi:hypothetical protein